MQNNFTVPVIVAYMYMYVGQIEAEAVTPYQ